MTVRSGATAASPGTRASPEVHYEVEQFLYDEADLLDEGRFAEWLELMAPDLRYWAPVRSNRAYRERHKEMSPPGESAYFEESREHIAQRVDRLHTRMAWAEDPPSRTRHIIGNVRVWEAGVADELSVDSAFFVYRTRLERDTDTWVGKRRDRVRRAPNAYGFEVVERMIVFDMSILLTKNISVFF